MALMSRGLLMTLKAPWRVLGVFCAAAPGVAMPCTAALRIATTPLRRSASPTLVFGCVVPSSQMDSPSGLPACPVKKATSRGELIPILSNEKGKERGKKGSVGME